MKMLISKRGNSKIKKIIVNVILILILVYSASLFFLPVKSLSEDKNYIYDLCYDFYPLYNGKLMFLKLKNALLDPVLKTIEIYIFDPTKSRLIFVPRYGEKIYLKPVVSPDKTTICYHSIIEGNDYLVTKKLKKKQNIRLSFDTGGYFLKLAISYDDDTVAAVIRRGKHKQAIYYISNSKGLLKRLINGINFKIIRFLKDGSILYLDNQPNGNLLGFVNYSRENFTISEKADFALPSPDGDAVIFLENNNLKFFRLTNRETITIIKGFIPPTKDPEDSIFFSPDGSSVSVITKDAVRIINIPSGDTFYYISMKLDNTTQFMTNYSYYITKGRDILILNYKKPGQAFKKLLEDDENIRILGANPDDRFVVYQKNDKNTVYVFDKRKEFNTTHTFKFEIEKISFLTSKYSFYIVGKSMYRGNEIRELYMYDFVNSLLYPISTKDNSKIEPYKRVKHQL